jgi:hypothetical protein
MPSQTTMSAPQNSAGATPDQKLPQAKAEALGDQTLGTRGFGGLDREATLYVLAAALLAESEDGYTRDSALGILQRARKVSLETLAASVRQVTKELAGVMTSFWSEFIKETWEGPAQPPQYVDPNIVAQRKDLEEKEQEQNRKDAVQYLNNTQIAISALVIDEKEFPKYEEQPKKTGPKIDLGKMVHNLVFKPAPQAKPGEGPRADPGWLTPPLIDKNGDDFTIFDNDITEIVSGRKLSGEQAWKKLEDRGYDRQRIVLAIYNVRKTARDQIAQCDQILSVIRTDYEAHIEPVLQAAVLLGHAISVVNGFYAPLPSPSDEEDTKPQPTPPPSRTRGRESTRRP